MSLQYKPNRITFRWNNGKNHVLLTAEEEKLLLEKVGTSPLDRVKYMTDGQSRHQFEQKMFQYLARQLRADPGAFFRHYERRAVRNDEAQEVYGAYLDYFSAITKKIAWHHEEFGGKEAVVIAILGPKRWPWQKHPVTSIVVLGADELDFLYGTPLDFKLKSSETTVHLNQESVNVFGDSMGKAMVYELISGLSSRLIDMAPVTDVTCIQPLRSKREAYLDRDREER